MPLTDVRIRQSKPKDKPYRMADGGGLFIEVRPSGSKLWRYAYRIGGKQNLFAVGAYPEVSLSSARDAHAKARALVQAGIHPSHDKAARTAKAVTQDMDTFKAVALAWIESKRTLSDRPGWSLTYEKQVRDYLAGDVFPKVGGRPMRGISSAEWLAILQAIEARGPSAAIFVRQVVSQVYSYAIPRLRANSDPTWPLRRAITRPPVRHAEPKGRDALRDLIQRLNGYGGNRTTVIAIRLLLLTFVRTAEARRARWCDFDLDAGLWSVPREHMKKRRTHLVPLAPGVVSMLRELQTITGANEHLFPNGRRPRDIMSATTVNRAMEHMGYPSGYFTGHDFRATASTRLHEMGYRTDIVDMQLAHRNRSVTSATYNHAEYLGQRTEMMRAWAAWIEQAEADTSPIKRPVQRLSKRSVSRRRAP
jgi:integrase